MKVGSWIDKCECVQCEQVPGLVHGARAARHGGEDGVGRPAQVAGAVRQAGHGGLCAVVVYYSTTYMQVTEYGADAVSGLHTLPSMMFTEDYQVKLTLYNTVYCGAGGAAGPVLVRVRLPAGGGLAGEEDMVKCGALCCIPMHR